MRKIPEKIGLGIIALLALVAIVGIPMFKGASAVPMGGPGHSNPDYFPHSVVIGGISPEENGSKRLVVDETSGMMSVQKREDGLWQPTSLKTGPESVWVGDRVGIAAAGHHIVTEDSDGHKHFHAHSVFDGETSTSETLIIDAYSYTERLVAQPDNSGSWTGTNHEYVALTTVHSMISQGYFQTDTTAATEPVRIQVWEGTDDTGAVVLDQTYPASTFPASSEVSITYGGYLEFDKGINYFIRQSSDASFSLKMDSTNTYPWSAANISFVHEDDILQTIEWVSGDTFTEGQLTVQDRQIYVCNVAGIQTGTFASNSDKWDLFTFVAPKTLAETLGYGNTTGGTDMTVSNGDDLIFDSGEATDPTITSASTDTLTITSHDLIIKRNAADNSTIDISSLSSASPAMLLEGGHLAGVGFGFVSAGSEFQFFVQNTVDDFVWNNHGGMDYFASSELMRLSNAGDLSFVGDLAVDGDSSMGGNVNIDGAIVFPSGQWTPTITSPSSDMLDITQTRTLNIDNTTSNNSMIAFSGNNRPAILLDGSESDGVGHGWTSLNEWQFFVDSPTEDFVWSNNGGIAFPSGTNELMRLTGDGELSVIDLRANNIAPNYFMIYTTEQLDALAVSGTITITEDTTIAIMASITTSNVFVLDGGDLILTANFAPSVNLTYSGTGTFVTKNETDDRFRLRDRITLVASSTGTLFDFKSLSASGLVSITDSNLNGWDLGTITNGSVQFQNAAFILYTDPLVLIDSAVLAGDVIAFVGGNLFDFQSADQESNIFSNIIGFTGFIMTAAPFTIDPFVAAGSKLQMSIMSTGSLSIPLFDVAGGSTGSYTAIADNSITSTSITSVTDNGGVAVFNHAGTDPKLGSTVEISGFITNTDYNGTFIVSSVSAGTFECKSKSISIAFGSTEASGSFTMTGVTVTSTAHGLSQGDTLMLDATLSTQYDRGYKIYNVQTNTFDVNATFGTTQAGTWGTSGIDESNSSVVVNLALENDSSKSIATAFVNNNSTANGAIVNNTFTDMVFGTGAGGLTEGSTIERWKLVDKLNGTFEYTGDQPFAGYITFDFTATSSGGAQDFRFKFLHDVGAGFVDLPDAVEALVEIGATAHSTSKTYPLSAEKGDQIKPVITRNSGISGITTTYATIYSSQ